MGGADNNRNIRTDRTSVFYGHGDLLRRKHMLIVFDMMASFVHPRTRIVDPERLLIEAGAVHQEFYLRGKDFIESLLDDLFHRTMYTKNPIRHRVDCEVEDLKSITPQDVERFLRRYYVPKNAFAIILGPKTEDAKAMAERYFADWEGKSTPILDYDHTDDFPELSSVRSFELERAGIGDIISPSDFQQKDTHLPMSRHSTSSRTSLNTGSTYSPQQQWGCRQRRIPHTDLYGTFFCTASLKRRLDDEPFIRSARRGHCPRRVPAAHDRACSTR